MKDRNAYIVVAPTGKSKIFSIAARRIGSKERYTVVATCQSDGIAEKIVDGLLLWQGEVVALEVPLQGKLDDTRQVLLKMQADIATLAQDKHAAVARARVLDSELQTTKMLLARAQNAALVKA